VDVIPDSHRDLAEKGGVGFLTTLGPDGSPQTTAVGFFFDHDAFLVTVKSSRQKVANVGRRSDCTLFLVDPANPYHALEIRGRAELVPDDDYVLAAKVAEHNGATVEQVRALDGPGEHRLCIRIHPVKCNVEHIAS